MEYLDLFQVLLKLGDDGLRYRHCSVLFAFTIMDRQYAKSKLNELTRRFRHSKSRRLQPYNSLTTRSYGYPWQVSKCFPNRVGCQVL